MVLDQALEVIANLQQGMQQGKLEIARNMLREGMTATTIAKVTGLPRKQLATLLKK